MNIASQMVVFGIAFGVAGCFGPVGLVEKGEGTGPAGDGVDPAGGGGGTAAACAPGKTYATFGGGALTEDRLQANAGVDRRRMKSYAVLSSEYERLLGVAPASLAAAGPTFGEPERRWYSEPGASAVTVHTNYLIAFDGCLDYLKDPIYQSEPVDTAAREQCSKLGRSFWSRELSPAELDTCASLATKGLSSEPNAKRKWAHVCASLLSSAGFLTY